MVDEKRPTAPYGAFDTTKNVFERFVEGVPPRIDRSAFPGLAWNAITRLIGGLRFLGFIDDAGNPLPALHAVSVPDEAKRKEEFEKVLRASYPEVFKLDLARVTPAHLAETLGQNYNAAGDTREKAVRFFISAAQYVGVPLSPLLTRERGRRPTGNIPRRTRTAPPRQKPIPQVELLPQQNAGATRTIRLSSGGTVTVTASVNFLALNAADRAFVFDLIDKLNDYVGDLEGDEEDNEREEA
jgi:hypothetical protein